MPSRFTPPLLPSTNSSSHLSSQGGLESEEEIFPEDDDEPPSSPLKSKNSDLSRDQEISELRPKKKAKRLKDHSSTSNSNQDLQSSSPTLHTGSTGLDHIDEKLINPIKPKIKSNNLFWKRPPPPPPSLPTPSTSTTSSSIPIDYSNCAFSDEELGLPPLTYQSSNDAIVKTLGISSTIPSSSSSTIHPFSSTNENENLNTKPFIYTRSDLIRYRRGKFSKFNHGENFSTNSNSNSNEEKEKLRYINIAQGAWKKWEELGGLPKGLSGLIPCSYDKNGNIYKPELTHVQAIRLVIAASPRGRMTLSQIYQAFEERWPWHKTAGATWKNSIRHNLSLNDCFVNIEKATTHGGGKGGYWIVDSTLSGKTARKLKRSIINSSSTSTSDKGQSNSSPIKSTFNEKANSNSLSRSNSTSNTSSPLNRQIPNIQVFSSPPSLFLPNSILPPGAISTSTSGSSSNPLINEIRASSSRSNQNGMDKKTAKPATPYPYILPKRDSTWIPHEVITSSREIGISRPGFDTPLDKRGQQVLEGIDPLVTSATESSYSDGIDTTRALAEDQINPSLQSRSKSIHPQIFTTRAGIPALPMVEPKPLKRKSPERPNNRDELRVAGEEGGEEDEAVLPNLIKAIYERPIEIDERTELPPVRGFLRDVGDNEGQVNDGE